MSVLLQVITGGITHSRFQFMDEQTQNAYCLLADIVGTMRHKLQRKKRDEEYIEINAERAELLVRRYDSLENFKGPIESQLATVLADNDSAYEEGQTVERARWQTVHSDFTKALKILAILKSEKKTLEAVITKLCVAVRDMENEKIQPSNRKSLTL